MCIIMRPVRGQSAGWSFRGGPGAREWRSIGGPSLVLTLGGGTVKGCVARDQVKRFGARTAVLS